jgi:outer membrane protein OmpA-like peptidoglycan-associated protein
LCNGFDFFLLQRKQLPLTTLWQCKKRRSDFPHIFILHLKHSYDTNLFTCICRFFPLMPGVFRAGRIGSLTLLFDWNSDLPRRDAGTMRKLEQVLEDHSDASVLLSGSADTTGNALYNTDLVRRRLENVESMLRSEGFAVTAKENEGETTAYGSLASNRCVHIRVSWPSPAATPVEESLTEKLTVRAGVPQVLKIEFQNNSDVIMSYSYGEVDKLYLALLDYPEYDIELHGHVCCMDHYTMSVNRAEAVRAALLGKGIYASRITVFGHSNKQPLVPEVDDASQQRNRRVEVVFRRRL